MEGGVQDYADKHEKKKGTGVFFQSPKCLQCSIKEKPEDIFHNITHFWAPSDRDMLSFHIVLNWSFQSTKCSVSDMPLFQSNEFSDFFCRNFPSFQCKLVSYKSLETNFDFTESGG